MSHAKKHDQLVAADQLAADEKQPKLFLPNRLACFTCLNVMPSGRFSDRNSYKARRVGGKDAHKRFCLDCGLKGPKYQVEQELYINGIHCILIRWSVEFTPNVRLPSLAFQTIGLWPDRSLGDLVNDCFATGAHYFGAGDIGQILRRKFRESLQPMV